MNIAVAFPGLLLALFFAVIFGVGATGAVLAIGLAGAPAFARLTQTLVAGVAGPRLRRRRADRRRRAGPRSCSGTCCPTSASRWSSTPRSAPAARCWPSPACPSSASACSRPSYDWGRLLYDGISAIYVNPAAALAPGIAVLVAGLAFNLFGESVAKGLGIGAVGGVPAAARRRRPRPRRRRPPPADAPHDSVRPGARRPRPRGHLPRPARPDPPGARRRPSRSGGARRSASWGSPGSGKSPDRAGGLAPGRRPRPGRRRPARAARHRPARRRTRRRSAACSAPRWRWCSRTR